MSERVIKRARPIKRSLLSAALLTLTSGAVLASPWPFAEQEWRETMQTADRTRRLSMVQGLAERPRALARPAVEVALSDPDPEVRQAAGRLALFFQFEGMSSRVESWFSSRLVTDRILALSISAYDRPPDAAERFSGLLSDPDRQVRVVAAESLGKLNRSQAEAASSYLLSGLDDPEPRVRALVARALGKLGRVSSALPLASHINDREAEVRAEIALSLGALGDDSVAPALVASLGDLEDEVVIAAVRSLGALEFEPGVFGILSLLERPFVDAVVREALATLVRIGSSEALRGVMERAQDPHFRVHLVAAFRNNPPKEVPGLESCIDQEVGERLAGCVKLWVALGRPTQPILDAVAASRMSAEDALGLLEDAPTFGSTVLALESLDSEKDNLRSAAYSYLGGLDELPAEAGEALRLALRSSRTAGEKAVLLAALGRCPDGSSRELAEDYVTSDEEHVARAASGLLVAQGVSGAALSSLLTSPRSAVSEGALSQLSRGMSQDQAETIIELLQEGTTGRTSQLLDVLWGVPRELSKSASERLVSLLEVHREGARDALLDALGRTLGDAGLTRLVPSLNSEDRFKLVQLCPLRAAPMACVSHFLTDERPRIRALAWERLGLFGSKEQVQAAHSQLAQNSMLPPYMLASFLRGLSSSVERKIVPSAASQAVSRENCTHPHPATRIEALRLAISLGTACDAVNVDDVLLLDPDARVRKAVARALGEHPPQSAALSSALRRCAFYETREEVAALCESALRQKGGDTSGKDHTTEKLEFKRNLSRVVVQPSWAFEPVPLYPVLVVSELGIVSVVSDRRGYAFVPDGPLEILDAALVF